MIKNRVFSQCGFESRPKILTVILARYFDSCGHRTFWQEFGVNFVNIFGCIKDALGNKKHIEKFYVGYIITTVEPG